MLPSKNKPGFWVTNISKKDVCLADLKLTIRRGDRKNLLDSRHFSYTIEELEKSRESGSLHAKSDKIKVSYIQPQEIVKPGVYIAKVYSGEIPDIVGKHVVPVEPIVRTARSQLKIVQKEYEELSLSDEKYAEDFLSDTEFLTNPYKKENS